jgi:transcriptional regulator
MTEFVKRLRAKGWTAQALAKHWGVTPRQISNIGKDPKQMHWDALECLPVKQKVKKGEL